MPALTVYCPSAAGLGFGACNPPSPRGSYGVKRWLGRGMIRHEGRRARMEGTLIIWDKCISLSIGDDARRRGSLALIPARSGMDSATHRPHSQSPPQFRPPSYSGVFGGSLCYEEIIVDNVVARAQNRCIPRNDAHGWRVISTVLNYN